MRKIIDERILIIAIVETILDTFASYAAYRLGLPAWAIFIVTIIPSTCFYKQITWCVNKLCAKSMELTAIIVSLAGICAAYILAKYGYNVMFEYMPFYVIPAILPPIIMAAKSQHKLDQMKKEITKRFDSQGKVFALNKESAEDLMNSVKGINRVITGKYDMSNAVKCENGIFVGRRKGNVKTFKGIPYAKPPVGKLRWQPPQRVEASEKVYEAYWYGSSEPQPYSKTTLASLNYMSEDCLTLNIWTSDADKDKRPVVVWTNTYEWSVGGTASPFNDGDNFVKENPDIVFVDINFRLGLFANMDFSDVPGGEEYSNSKNLHIQDQIEALKWIKRNISQFGGDPENITLVGSGSAGIGVVVLSAVKAAKGLFNKAISLGGCVIDTVDVKTFNSYKEEVSGLFRCKTMDEYLALSSEKLMQAMSELDFYAGVFPVKDGKLIPENLEESFKAGDASEVSVVFSIAKHESMLAQFLIGDKEISQDIALFINSIVGGLTKEQTKCLNDYIEKYHGNREADIAANNELLTELFAHYPMLKLCQAHSASNGDGRYLFWDVESSVKGVGSTSLVSEIILRAKEEYGPVCGVVGDATDFQMIRKIFVNYMKNGIPSLEFGELYGVNPVDWPNYKQTKGKIMVASKYGLNLDDRGFSEKINMLEPLNDVLFMLK